MFKCGCSEALPHHNGDWLYWNAGTDANVFITLYGEHGDTGVRQLWRTTGSPSSKSFTRNKVSVEYLIS